ncbi:MAG: PKD domain-containing protein [Anaerolineales bacterium]
MFRKSSTFILVMILSLALTVPALAAPLATATTVPGGNVSGTWDASGSPYLIDGDITVPAGQTLTIEPGVDVLFQSWYSLTVNGTLNADGTENAPILFGGGHETAGWKGIRFVGASDSSSLTYATVENGRAAAADPFDRGGGIYIEDSSPTISHSTIRNNFAKYSGGGIYLTNSNATLIGNTIINNQAGQGGTSNGGGLAIWYSNPVLTDNIISGNTVAISGSYTTPSGYGGGLFLRSSDATLTGNLISENHVNAAINSNARGGGLYLYYGSPVFVNNTITGNTLENESTGYYSIKEGGGIYTYNSNPTFVNTILWGNAPLQIFAADYGYTSTYTFAYSDVQDGLAGIETNDSVNINLEGGNSTQDPQFVDAAGGDFTLQSSSPLIDAGTAYFEWNGQVLVDLSSAEYNGSAPDMGAFEFGNGGSFNQPPVAIASVTPDHGSAPLTVQFSSTDSYDPDGTLSATSWDFGDGSSSTEADPSHSYTDVGIYQATLTVTDNDGSTHSDSLSINVQDGTTINAGNVSGTWDAAGSPYRIEGDIIVPTGATLTIEPDALVSFQSWYSLTVNGTLLADGTAGEPILFTGTDSPGWLGIRFVNASDNSLLDNVIVEKGRATGADPLNRGGGIYIDGSNPTISNSTIRDNFAVYSGGGLYLNNSNATLVGNSILNNQAGQGGTSSGGGLAILYSNPILTNNVISGNSVGISGSYTTPSGHGGGLYLRSSDAVFTGNLISDNHVNGFANSNARGGGLYLYTGSPVFVNNTITGNSVENSSGVYSIREGGGIYTLHSNPTFVNTILWNDTPQELFAADYGVNSTYTIAYSDIQGGQAGIVTNNSVDIIWEAGNIDSDPLLNGDFTLQENSPAVDAGTAYYESNGSVLVDLSSGEYNGNTPDMGAFESPYTGSGGGSNQVPVAVASANPQSGEAPLAVQFNGDSSYDPDGTITAYAWDFGDGNTSNAANPSHTYADAGTFNAVLTVTDDQGATGSATVTIDVAQVSQNELHVQAQSVSREQLNKRFWQGVNTILISDQNNQPVAGVTVTATYSGPNSGQVSGLTGSDGTVTLYTDKQRRPRGSWCFEVTEVTKSGYSYNPSANVVTTQCE